MFTETVFGLILGAPFSTIHRLSVGRCDALSLFENGFDFSTSLFIQAERIQGSSLGPNESLGVFGNIL